MSAGYPIRPVAAVPTALLAGVLAGMLSGACLSAQTSEKPSAAVSSFPVAQPTGATNLPEASTKQAPQHLDVNYSDGKLTVDATNASLNEILREVSRKTGIKVTGGVPEDRVFGRYGPSSPAMVLDTLLQGTESNVLLVAATESATNRAGPVALPGSRAMAGSELILTPRRGGVSPPNANVSAQSADADAGAGQYVPPARPYQPPVPNGRNVIAAPSADGLQTPGGDGTDSSGPKTPQQIYDQLQRTMQRQQQTPQSTPQ